jgi:LPXTG-motif cell wall-anchored protein
MYNELPHTGFGALLLTGVALVITAAGWLLRKLSRS